MLFKSGLVAGLLVLATTVGANASPYYNSLSTNNAGTSSAQLFPIGSAFGNAFTATGSTMSEVEIALERYSTSLDSAGSVVITLNADNGLSGTADGPGALLYSLGTVTDASLVFGNISIIDITNLGIVSLTPGTKYWIEVARAAGTVRIEAVTTASAATTGAGNFAYKAGTASAFLSNASAPPEMSFCVSGDNSCTATNFALNGAFAVTLSQSNPGVPEPATMAILGSGLVGLGWSRRRAKAKRTV